VGCSQVGIWAVEGAEGLIESCNPAPIPYAATNQEDEDADLEQVEVHLSNSTMVAR